MTWAYICPNCGDHAFEYAIKPEQDQMILSKNVIYKHKVAHPGDKIDCQSCGMFLTNLKSGLFIKI